MRLAMSKRNALFFHERTLNHNVPALKTPKAYGDGVRLISAFHRTHWRSHAEACSAISGPLPIRSSPLFVIRVRHFLFHPFAGTVNGRTLIREFNIYSIAVPFYPQKTYFTLYSVSIKNHEKMLKIMRKFT